LAANTEAGGCDLRFDGIWWWTIVE
jgi:hypothetical protein